MSTIEQTREANNDIVQPFINTRPSFLFSLLPYNCGRRVSHAHESPCSVANADIFINFSIKNKSKFISD
jgi:hypothetical protein